MNVETAEDLNEKKWNNSQNSYNKWFEFRVIGFSVGFLFDCAAACHFDPI